MPKAGTSPTSTTARAFPHSAAVAAPLAAVLFLVSVTVFAALRDDGYSHAHKAISELGASGAPHAFAFNALGFVAPGLLVVAFAVGFVGLIRSGGSLLGPGLLGLSGVTLALAGIFPVDMAQRDSWASLAHLASATASGIFWACSLFWMGRLLARVPVPAVWVRLTPWFVLFPVANVAWQAMWQTTGWPPPGWGQRLAFAGYFLWLAVTGAMLRRTTVPPGAARA
ncbi:DUF998 domain-containing protein [Streptosporangium sp. NPDC051023]|uniref:DUF998 domain-containing protein n=1 Tax=Streptosporangium sp. NPDC051023 TaxID=3155410 RepID=UPI00344E6F3A